MHYNYTHDKYSSKLIFFHQMASLADDLYILRIHNATTYYLAKTKQKNKNPT